ncbi:MAG: bifunctional demethylmenaquinone methyltransferase/2-methoxy-6-polyprenyl-1,4-benzoquinol methylase UbiE [bacterium]|nr:bifunctional demethylmenaquinone methyltransferase/2-methoxy-6-polyprenyl-1,4-benzoquinol methylase UbiE [bacterium]
MKEIAIKVPIESPSRVDVYRMFDKISTRYDLLNRVLSLGMDLYWRRVAIRELDNEKHLRVLDLACGTGDIAMAAAKATTRRQVIGIDRAEQMLALAYSKVSRGLLSNQILLACGDGMNIPVADGSMDAATIAFGIRNMPDTSLCLGEMKRTLRTNGKLIVLEFSLPKNRILRSLHLFYLRRILPVIGRWLSGDNYAYSYLNKTIETYPHGAQFVELMQKAGFTDVQCRPLTLGIVSLYTGIKN